MEKLAVFIATFQKTNPNCYENIINDLELHTGLNLNSGTHSWKTYLILHYSSDFPAMDFFKKTTYSI